jgi:hypothetical protein
MNLDCGVVNWLQHHSYACRVLANITTEFTFNIVLWSLLHIFRCITCFPKSFHDLCLFWAFVVNYVEDLAFFSNNVRYEPMVVHLLGASRQKCFSSYISSLVYPGFMCPYETKHCSPLASMTI